MSEYTPTTDEIRAEYCTMTHYGFQPDGAEFDRWLAEVERAAAEKAWDEGREYHAFSYGCGPDTWDCDCPNPYRREEA